MENLVVTLETAQKLKAAGFPQDKTAYVWRYVKENGVSRLLTWAEQDYDNERFRLSRNSFHIDNEFYDSPTAQEIADQLPEEIVIEHHMKWRVINHAPGPSELVLVEGDSMAEALAALYLHIHEVQS